MNMWDHINPGDPNAYYTRDYSEDVESFIEDALREQLPEKHGLRLRGAVSGRYVATVVGTGLAAVIAWRAAT